MQEWCHLAHKAACSIQTWLVVQGRGSSLDARNPLFDSSGGVAPPGARDEMEEEERGALQAQVLTALLHLGCLSCQPAG